MNGTYVALAAVSLLALAFLMWALLEDDSRRHWKTHDKALREQLDFDEALLDELLGARQVPDQADPFRRLS
jgi:hypothetical protein